jgi:ribosomal protein S18 acetylase RimI-like enzyme
MIAIEKVAANEGNKFEIIRGIASATWPITYGEILTQEQIEYMFEMMYSTNSLQEQATKQNLYFLLANVENSPLGFASYESNYNETMKTKIHKIYILPSAQGKGIGKKLIDYIIDEAKMQQNTAVILNVNKYNKAQHFYTKIGFSIASEEIIDIGKGYVMDDYVMEKLL